MAENYYEIRMNTLAKEIHGIALSKGWYDREISEFDFRNNFCAEVAEAWEEYRKGRMDLYYDENGKPQGFWIEIADILIRVLDCCAHLDIMIEEISPETIENTFWRCGANIESIDNFIDMLFKAASMAYFQGSYNLSCLIKMVIIFFEKNNVDIFEIVRIKSEYNKTRPYRHGGKIA